MKEGIYRHYKGGLYEVVGIATNSETLEKEVVYKMLYSTPDFPVGSLWTRPKTMFEEDVFIDGKKQKRFEYIGDKKYKEI